MTNIKEELLKIKAFAFDVDGVFSTNKVYLHPSGDMMRSMNTKDGYAIQYLVKKGYPVAIITGASSESIKDRFQPLGVTDIYLKASNKMDCFEDFIYKYGLNAGDVLYMGDDIPDYQVMKITGVAVCPDDAVEEIKDLCPYISDKKGGEGCVRDIVEQVLKVQGKWLDQDAFNW